MERLVKANPSDNEQLVVTDENAQTPRVVLIPREDEIVDTVFYNTLDQENTLERLLGQNAVESERRAKECLEAVIGGKIYENGHEECWWPIKAEDRREAYRNWAIIGQPMKHGITVEYSVRMRVP